MLLDVRAESNPQILLGKVSAALEPTDMPMASINMAGRALRLRPFCSPHGMGFAICVSEEELLFLESLPYFTRIKSD